MWAWAFLIAVGEGILTTSGTSVASIDCERSLDQVCPFNATFPDSKQEFAAFCPRLLTYVRCNQNYGESCRRTEGQSRQNQRFVDTVRAVCEKGSSLNRALGDNARCISSTYLNDYVFNCTDASRRLRALYRNFVEYSPYNFRKTMCLNEYSNVACAKRIFQKECGTAAAQASQQVFGLLRLFDQYCASKNVEEFRTVIPQLNLTEEVKESLLEVLNL
uniref:U39-Deinotoxin-Dsu1a_1 n=1 Tax=Deinopis subrufa TaxID=1905329 RepID=A0A4Q8KAL2_DEISU